MSSVNWVPFGEFEYSICKSILLQSAGLYRLTFDDYVLIGKASKGLGRRLREYHKPCSGVEHENVISLMLHEACTRGVKVELAVFVTDDFSHLERQEIQGAIQRGEKLLNKGGLGQVYYLKFKIRYYEQILTEARNELIAAETSISGRQRH